MYIHNIHIYIYILYIEQLVVIWSPETEGLLGFMLGLLTARNSAAGGNWILETDGVDVTRRA